MIKSSRHIYLFAAGTIVLSTAAALCWLAQNSMDIFFLGAGIVLSVITFKEYRKIKEENRAGSY
jgi:positive regulator of sigma E activity